MDLSVIRAKLNKESPRRYSSPDQFVADVYLMFHNCAKFNYVSYIFYHYKFHFKLIWVSNLSAKQSCHDSKGFFFLLSDYSPTLRWPKQGAAWRRSSPQSWKTFSQIDISRWLRWILTATSMTRPAGLLMAASSGQRGGSSVTGRGRGVSRSSRGGITSNRTVGKKLCTQNLFFFISQFFSDSLWGDKRDFFYLIYLYDQCCGSFHKCQCCLSDGSWKYFL